MDSAEEKRGADSLRPFFSSLFSDLLTFQLIHINISHVFQGEPWKNYFKFQENAASNTDYQTHFQRINSTWEKKRIKNSKKVDK